MITKLLINNYKSIGDPGVTLDVRPLTILLGPNGSGKSSILEAPCILSQGEGSTLPESLKDRELIQYPALEDIAHKGELNKSISIEVHIKLSKEELLKIRKVESKIPSISHIEISQEESIGYRYSYNPGTREIYHSIVIGGNEIAKCGYVKKGDQSFEPSVIFILPNPVKEMSQTDPRTILNSGIFIPRRITPDQQPVVELAELAQKIIRSNLSKKVFLISAFRGDINFEGDAKASPKWVGKRGENLIEIIALIFGDRRYRRIRQKIIEWAEKFDISGLSAGWLGKSALSVDYVDSTLDTSLKLALAGFGSRQIMAIITQIFWGKSGDIIIIEEPEISLHPNSQAMLPELFADAITEGKQILVSTHSLAVPLSLQRAIKKRLISLKDIAVYHVEKSEKGTKVKRLRLNRYGYVRGWIPSYAKVESQLISDWAQTLPKYEK